MTKKHCTRNNAFDFFCELGNKGSKRRTIIMATSISGFAMLLAVGGLLGSYIHQSKSKRREKGILYLKILY